MAGRAIIYLTFCVFFSSTTILTTKAERAVEKNDSALNSINHLRELYSINKTIPSEFEKEILITLSHYPELSNVKIKFCYASIFTSMKAVPTFGFIFHKRENRTYRIVMNEKKCKGKNIMQRTSQEALTGVLGHELGHIKDYSQLSNCGLIKLLAGYVSKKGRIETEKRADKCAIDHGLGKQLLEFNEQILNDACINPKYLRYKKKFYNSTTTISTMINDQANVSSF